MCLDLVVTQLARCGVSEMSLSLSPDLRYGKQLLLCIDSVCAHGRRPRNFELVVVLLSPTLPTVNAPGHEVQVRLAGSHMLNPARKSKQQ